MNADCRTLRRAPGGDRHGPAGAGHAYRFITRGIPLGSQPSPLMGELYLARLDRRMEAMAAQGVFYVRFMDDWVVLAPPAGSPGFMSKARTKTASGDTSGDGGGGCAPGLATDNDLASGAAAPAHDGMGPSTLPDRIDAGGMCKRTKNKK